MGTREETVAVKTDICFIRPSASHNIFTELPTSTQQSSGKATLRGMETANDRDRAAHGVGEVGKHNFLEAVFDQVSGRAGLAANGTVAGFMQRMRNLITSARLGSASSCPRRTSGRRGLRRTSTDCHKPSS